MTISLKVQTLQQRILQDWDNSRKTGGVLLLLWLVSMVTLPITFWTAGDEAIPAGVNISALIQTSAVLWLLKADWGWRRTLYTLGLVAVVTWAAEFVGSSTGFPFGEYSYTERLQPQVGHVPLLIPFAWFMMLPSAWAIAQAITGRERPTLRHRLAFIGVSAIALTAWDLFLDPQMVGWGFWEWAHPEGYFGIPWSNYGGWLLVAAVVTAIVRPPALRLTPFITIYAIVWFLQSFGQAVFWGQVGPALVGCVVMGGLMLAAWMRTKAAQA